MKESLANYLQYFDQTVLEGTEIPTQFTFPFYYTPHPLAVEAASLLQSHLESHEFDHNFGLNPSQDGLPIGKMFGVLVVQDVHGRLGYLWAFSGKLAGSNDHPLFVPPVFDMLTQDGFFLQEEKIINDLNDQISAIVSSKEYLLAKSTHEENILRSNQEIISLKKHLNVNK